MHFLFLTQSTHVSSTDKPPEAPKIRENLIALSSLLPHGMGLELMYLGYLHSIQFAKPSLVCDIQEIFRGLIDEFLIVYAQKLNEDDFERKGDRMFLKRKESYKMIKAINELFDKRIEHQRIKKFGKYSTIRTAIREEPIKLAQYLRREKGSYEPVEAFL